MNDTAPSPELTGKFEWHDVQFTSGGALETPTVGPSADASTRSSETDELNASAAIDTQKRVKTASFVNKIRRQLVFMTNNSELDKRPYDFDGWSVQKVEQGVFKR